MIECLKRAQQRYDAHARGRARSAARRRGARARRVRDAAQRRVRQHPRRDARARVAGRCSSRCARSSPAARRLIADSCELAIDRVIGREIGDGSSARRRALAGSRTCPRCCAAAAPRVYVTRPGDRRRASRSHARARADAAWSRRAPATTCSWSCTGAGSATRFAARPRAPQRFRKQVEVITEDDVWRRKAFLFVEAQLFALTGDLPGLQAHGRGDRRARAESSRAGGRGSRWTRARAASLARRARAARSRARAGARRWRGRASIARASRRAGARRAAAPARRRRRRVARSAAGPADARAPRSTAPRVVAERIRALAAERARRARRGAAHRARVRARAASSATTACRSRVLHEAQARIALAAGAVDACGEALTELRRRSSTPTRPRWSTRTKRCARRAASSLRSCPRRPRPSARQPRPPSIVDPGAVAAQLGR